MINGVCTQSLSQQIESIFALITGITIGLYFSWKTTIACLIGAPLIILNA
jgi:ATP-binding cassette, subfamily B (MDR/TAP), member 1